MKTVYRSERRLVSKYELIQKMEYQLQKAEKEQRPQRYIQRLADSIVAVQQTLNR